MFCILGPDWKWGNQDGGSGNIGRVFAVNNGTVEVTFFDSRTQFTYFPVGNGILKN